MGGVLKIQAKRLNKEWMWFIETGFRRRWKNTHVELCDPLPLHIRIYHIWLIVLFSTMKIVSEGAFSGHFTFHIPLTSPLNVHATSSSCQQMAALLPLQKKITLGCCCHKEQFSPRRLSANHSNYHGLFVCLLAGLVH